MIQKLIAIEKIKTLNYSSFWLILALFSLLILLGYYISGSFGTVSINHEQIDLPDFQIYEFPMLWHYLTYISGFLHYLPALLVILLVTNDLQYGLWRQHIAEGLGRGELIWGKVLVITILSCYATLLLVVIGLVLGLGNTANVSLGTILERADFLVGYFVQIFSYMTIAFLFAVLAKKPALAIILLLVYGIVLERVIRFYLPEELSFYMPVAAFSGIISNPYMSILGVEVIETPFINNFFVSLIWILVILGVIYMNIRSRDM